MMRWYAVLAVLLCFALAAPAGLAGELSEEERSEIEAVVKQNLEATEEEDLDGVLETLHPDSASHDDEAFVEEMEYIFENYDLEYELEILNVHGDSEEARVEYSQVTTSEDNEDFQDNQTKGIHLLVPYDDQWKILATEVRDVQPVYD